MVAVLLAIGPMQALCLAQPALQTLASQQLTAQAKQDSAKPDTKSAATNPADDAGAWVMLDGRRVIEIKSAAGAQNPKDVARRITGHLERLVRNPGFRADRIVVRDQDPYATVGLLASDGKFLPGLA
ncbi:MAG: hypothetical protein K0U63_09875, partial [Cyanobacteria bacterium]|nr:hypothetical protein [Cyanobacteriota bacterium]